MYSTAKILRHPERLAEWMRQGRTTTPIGFDIHLTNACPHKCEWCNGDNRSGGFLTEREAIDYLEQLRFAGARAVHFCGGGEPLAHSKCASIVKRASEIGFGVGFITNLFMLSPSDATTLKNCCDWVRVSLDAGTPETYAKTHGVHQEVFWTVLDNIKRLTSTKGRARVGVAMLTTPETEPAELRWFGQLLPTLGCDYGQVRPVNNTSQKVPVVESTIPIYTGKYQRERPTCYCYGTHFWCVIDANANLKSCCEAGVKYGNLRTSSFSEIWGAASTLKTMEAIDPAYCPSGCRMARYNSFLEGIANPIAEEAHI